MSWFGRVRAAYRSITLADFPQLSLAPRVQSGISVSPSTALNYSAYWDAVNILSGQVALLPRVVYKRMPDDERERATSHPAYRVIHDAPNEYMTPFVFWQTLMSHALTWGNGYAEIEWDSSNRPKALWPITPDQIEPKLEGKKLVYVYQRDRPIQPEDILHIPGFGYDGIRGYSVASMARESIGLGLAAERFGASFFGNGAMPGMVLEHPGKLSKEASERLKASWRRDHGGDGALGVAVAEEGMKVNKIGIPPDDAQFLESREFQVVEMARWFNLPPHKLKHKVGERPGGNLESSQIEFLTDSLMPWLVRSEQECNRKLLQGDFYCEHLVAALLRPDAATRVTVQKAYFDMGVLDAEQIAKQENLPKPKPKPVPVVAPPPAPAPAPTENKALQVRWARENALDAAGRLVRRDILKLQKLSKRGPDGFETTLEQYYRAETPTYIEMLRAAVGTSTSIAGLSMDVDAVTRGVVAAYVAESRDALGSLPAKSLEETATEMLKRWTSTRPAMLADAIERSIQGSQANG